MLGRGLLFGGGPGGKGGHRVGGVFGASSSQVANPHNAFCIKKRAAAKPKEAQVHAFDLFLLYRNLRSLSAGPEAVNLSYYIILGPSVGLNSRSEVAPRVWGLATILGYTSQTLRCAQQML